MKKLHTDQTSPRWKKVKNEAFYNHSGIKCCTEKNLAIFIFSICMVFNFNSLIYLIKKEKFLVFFLMDYMTLA